MSRGKGCAGFNEAGIYTRVKKKLKWIFKHIRDDNCEDAGEDEEEEEEEEEDQEEDV